LTESVEILCQQIGDKNKAKPADIS